MKNKIGIFLLSSIVSINCFADSNISAPKGAFGVNFGDNISKLNVIRTGELTNGEKLYEISAPIPLSEKIESYYVLITPKTNKVFEIWGDKNYDNYNREMCNTEKQNLLSILENKYGKSESIGMFNVDDDRMINIGNIVISASCRNLGKNMSLRYADKNLRNQYNEEKKQLLIEKTDASML